MSRPRRDNCQVRNRDGGDHRKRVMASVQEQQQRLGTALRLLDRAKQEIAAAGPLPAALDLRIRAELELVWTFLSCARSEVGSGAGRRSREVGREGPGPLVRCSLDA